MDFDPVLLVLPLVAAFGVVCTMRKEVKPIIMNLSSKLLLLLLASTGTVVVAQTSSAGSKVPKP
jgi:hypothetical protein